MDEIKVGDKVKVVAGNPHNYDTYQNGDILDVVDIDIIGSSRILTVDTLDKEGDPTCLFESEVEKVKETPSPFVFILESGAEFTINPVEGDAVEHPSHYTSGKFETIEVIEDITSGYEDGFLAHCVGTATKYIYRAPHKHETPLEDLRKAAKYLEFAIKHLEDR